MTNKTFLDAITKEDFTKLAQAAVAKAREENLRLGLPETVWRDGKWVRQYPGGRIEAIENRPNTRTWWHRALNVFRGAKAD